MVWAEWWYLTGIQEIERAREGVAVLMKDVWNSTVTDFLYVSSRALWVKVCGVIM